LIKIVLCLFLGMWTPLFSQFGFSRIDDDPLSEEKKLTLWTKPHFNRVEGFFLHGGAILNVTPGWGITTYVQGGYGFNNKGWRYNAGLEKRFFEENRTLLQFNVFDETASNDFWITNTYENSLAALLMREDFCNYFERKGWEILLDQKLFRQHLVRIQYDDNEYGDMATFSNFPSTLFGWEKKFRANPPVVVGREKRVAVAASFDWRDNPNFPRHGLYLEIKYVKTYGDFQTSGLFVDSHLFYPTFGTQKIFLRTMAGLRQGSLAPQYLLSIGGIGRMCAFQEFYRTGQNFAFMYFFYHLGDDISRILPLPSLIKEGFSIGFFYEMGDAWYHDKVKSSLTGGYKDIQWLADGGFSILFADGLLRIDCARQLIGGRGDWRITGRFFKPI
jgi:outer membrane protein assembly factor BamA